MITLAGLAEHNLTQSADFFLDKSAAGFYGWQDWSTEKGLERMVFRVSRNPGYLTGHLERIYYCFEHKLDEQLFGALLDLLIVLGKKGKALGRRMIKGSQPQLTFDQIHALDIFLESNEWNPCTLPFNRYSIFTDGLLSRTPLIQIVAP